MAFSNAPNERMDELRLRSQQSSRTDSALLGLVSPRRGAPRLPLLPQSQDARINLPRRFTTDSGRVPTLNSLAGPSGRVPDGVDIGTSNFHKVQLLEKKKLEYERLRAQKRRFEAEMQLLDLQQRREEQELAQMAEDLKRGITAQPMGAGHQSEPSTPPEYRETSTGFPTPFSRPNRYSTSSLMASPPSSYSRPGRSGSILTSPQSGMVPSLYNMEEQMASRSVPGSRRNSDEDEKEQAVRQDPTSHRSGNAFNRYSMPVTKSRSSMQDLSLDQTNTTRFLFGDDEEHAGDAKSFLQVNATEENFPILVRHHQRSGSSAAQDLSSSSEHASGSDTSGWSAFGRHNPRHSLPANNGLSINGQNGATTNGSSTSEKSINGRASVRHSLDLKYFRDGQKDMQITPPRHVQATPPKLHSSYSTNDVPTMKNTNGMTPNNGGSNSHAQQHFHNHNASLGRIPQNAMSNRLSRDLSSLEVTPSVRDIPASQYPTQSSLHASAPAFGPVSAATASMPASSGPVTTPAMSNGYAMPGYYNNYNMQIMAMGMQNLQLTQQMYPGQGGYSNYGGGYTQNGMRAADSQSRIIAQRKHNDGEAMNRFANLQLDSLGGEIYTLCKDQHGCRYLQKKLEERNPEDVHMIWLETNQHVIELMTDPFGNYLCQKLLEYCNDEERTVLIENSSRDLVRIALNQHGTRALQKMIEFISTPTQVQMIIAALRYQVVELIQDLNGNHVIQKCLNKLSPTDAQFIFDAVGTHCVDVGTHRHGCCVLQRCIDHASGDQKAWLIRQISNNAITLVQDPFGNYVVQYILDLNETIYTEPLVAMFQGRVGQLSRQKFSSNVIEKCLRCASEASKDMLVDEMLQPSELDRLLRDSFANYVIQTALDFASPAMKARLIDAIRPILPAIRTTPYGRRIQAKIQGNEGRSGPSSGQQTPSDSSSGQLPLRGGHQRAPSTASSTSFVTPSTVFSNGYSSPARSTPSSFTGSQLAVQQNGLQQVQPNYGFQYSRGAAHTGAGNYF